jgi:DNA-binding GntR family transcriptional regulator
MAPRAISSAQPAEPTAAALVRLPRPKGRGTRATGAERDDGGTAAPAPPAFETIRRRTLNDEVYLQLRERLMTGALAPGATLTIRDLAASFGISPMPVREALRRLVAEHALVLLPNRSVAVPALSAERFAEITEIRMALEGLAAELATPRIADAAIVHMRRCNARMFAPTDAGDPEFFSANREFHFTLYRASGRPTLITLIESMWLQIGPVLTFVQNHSAYRRRVAPKHHNQVLTALARRDPARVRAGIVGDLADAARVVSRHL